LVGCASGAHFNLHVPLEPRQLAGAQVAVCRNGVCASIRLPRLAHDDGAILAFEDRFAGPLRATPAGSRLVTQLSAGWSLIRVFEGAPEPHVDGDLYSAEVTSADGALILRIERRVIFSDYYPNGKECDQVPCRGAAMDLWPASASGLSCTAHACASETTFEANLPLHDVRLAGATVEICRNEACSHAVLEPYVDMGGFSESVSGALSANVGRSSVDVDTFFILADCGATQWLARPRRSTSTRRPGRRGDRGAGRI
jgi:hypothetical protein